MIEYYNSTMAKFDWVPYLQGKYLNYYQWFAFIAGFALVCLSFLSFLTYLLLCKFVPPSARKSIPQKLKTITFNATFVFLSIIPLICGALDVVYLFQGMIGMMFFLTIMTLLDNGRKNWNDDDELGWNTWNRRKRFISGCLKFNNSVKKDLIKNAIISVVCSLFLYKTCLCFYNFEVGYYNNLLGFGINTYVTRIFQFKDSCPVGAPCQMYATIPQDPAHAFFLNLHTHKSVKNVIVYYQQLDTADPTTFWNVTAQTYQYHGLEFRAARSVHSALITDLKPNTKYLTKVFYDKQYWTNAIYKTLPDTASTTTPIRMINGGDSGYTHAALNLSIIASKLRPDIFFMGGDVAYDDNMPACAYTWDYYLRMYGQLTATLGYLMPMVLSVGNHDVGLNELPGINITINNYGPAYFIYFPQHYDRNLDGHIVKRVPPINHRRSITNFTFANVHYLCLDSGYLHHFQGYQKQFMIDSFQANKDKIKFVNYHVPIYSVCQAFDRDPSRYLYALFHWVPNFDKYKVMTVFQNHVHSFKRTKPLIGNTPHTNGTVYLGDGSYGALISEMCKPDITMDIFDAFSRSNNMWSSDIYADRVQHTAYDSLGRIIDKFVQKVDTYRLP